MDDIKDHLLQLSIRMSKNNLLDEDLFKYYKSVIFSDNEDELIKASCELLDLVMSNNSYILYFDLLFKLNKSIKSLYSVNKNLSYSFNLALNYLGTEFPNNMVYLDLNSKLRSKHEIPDTLHAIVPVKLGEKILFDFYARGYDVIEDGIKIAGDDNVTNTCVLMGGGFRLDLEFYEEKENGIEVYRSIDEYSIKKVGRFVSNESLSTCYNKVKGKDYFMIQNQEMKYASALVHPSVYNFMRMYELIKHINYSNVKKIKNCGIISLEGVEKHGLSKTCGIALS